MEIQIETGVPVPVSSRASGAKYPFGQLSVGQSFFVPGVKRPAFSSRAHNFAKKQSPQWKFKVSAAEKDGVAGMRVWRIA